MLALNYNGGEIAEALTISARTVRSHIENIRGKLEACIAGSVAKALIWGWLPLDFEELEYLACNGQS